MSILELLKRRHISHQLLNLSDPCFDQPIYAALYFSDPYDYGFSVLYLPFEPISDRILIAILQGPILDPDRVHH